MTSRTAIRVPVVDGIHLLEVRLEQEKLRLLVDLLRDCLRGMPAAVLLSVHSGSGRLFTTPFP
ncbi:hypothetical protein [Mycobacterium sp. URHB0021]